MPILSYSELRHFAGAVIAACGSDAGEADLVGAHLADANLAGHDSHGVGMLPTYVDEVQRQLLRPNTAPVLLRSDGSMLAFDGGHGFGQRVAHDAMRAAIERAHEHGLCLFTLRNAGHVGRVGACGEQATAAGLVSVHFVNVTNRAPSVAPWGGREARLATNPICVAVPGTDSRPALLLDMATSRYAMGKVRVAKNAGRALPPGMLMNASGDPDTDPNAMYAQPRGALFPFGEYKGAGLGLVCELLAGVLSGNGSVQPEHARHDGIVNNMLALLVDPQRLVPGDWMQREIESLLDYVRSSTPRPGMTVQIAGEPEQACRQRRLRDGIEIDQGSWSEIEAAAASAGIDDARRARLLR